MAFDIQNAKDAIEKRSLVIVGLMGCGKTTIGRLFAQKVGCQFFDSDIEIEKASSLSISDIFAAHGEAAFREAEEKVIRRLLEGPPCVLATGGGAFMNAYTRDTISKNGMSLWIKADLDTLMKRVMRKKTRPLLQNDNPRGIMADLIDKRYPTYALADMTVESGDFSKDEMVERLGNAVNIFSDE